MNRKTFLICVLIVLAGGGISWWLIQSSQEKELARDEQAYQIIQKSKIVIPTVQSYETINSANLPAELTPLLTGRITAVRSIVYEGGKSGYIIITRVSDSLSVSRVYQDQQKDLVIDRKWKLISGYRSEAFSMLEVESPNYQIRLMYDPRDDGEVQVSAEVLTN